MTKEELFENPDPNVPIRVTYFNKLSEEEKKKVMNALPKGRKIVFEKLDTDGIERIEGITPAYPVNYVYSVANKKPKAKKKSAPVKKKAPATPKKKTVSRKAKRK